MFTETVRGFYHRLDALSGGRLAVISRAVRRFDRNRGLDAAATISYYTIFSVFPLLIFTITALSYFVDPEAVIERLTELTKNLPISPESIILQVEEVLKARTTFNLIALVGFLWAGSGAFNTLVASLDRAWEKVGQRNIVQHRMIAILMVVLLAMLMFISIIYTTLIDLSLFLRLFSIDGSPLLQSLMQGASAHAWPFILRFTLIWLLYRLIPSARVDGWAAFWGALFASLAWGLATAGFSWYLSSGLARYDLIYGSLGAIIAFLTWIYLSALIILLGAYLTEAIEYRKASLIAGDQSTSTG
jgi:membrane protein